MAYIRLEYPKIQVLKDDGSLAIGYKVYCYVAGTDTLTTTYSDRLLSSENTNPIILDARGEANLFTNQAIKLVLKTDAGVLVWSQDYVGEMLATFYTGSSTGTTDNVYEVTVSPIPSSYTANMTVIFTPDVDNAETIGAFAFTGTGPNDCQMKGPYTGSTSSTFRVEIDGTGSPNTFKWRKDVEAYVTTVPITGAWQTLKEGMEVKFSTLTGHINGAYWTQAVDPPCKIDVAGVGEKLVYKNVGGVMQLLDGSDIIADFPATIVYSAEQDCWILNNPATQTGSTTSVSSGIRDRFEKTDNYTLTTNDAGNLIDMNVATAKTLTLDAAGNYNGMFFYIRAGGAGTVTIQAALGELIYSRQKPEGANTYTLVGDAGAVIQMQCNGVSWEVLTETHGPITIQSFATVGTFSGANGYTHTPGKKYAVVMVRGGGGGGGSNLGGGGGGGGFGIEVLAVSALTEPVTVTVGSGGTGGVHLGAAAVDGGVSSFGAYLSASGGVKGQDGGSGGAGGGGGTGTGADYQLAGQAGQTSGSPSYGGGSGAYLGGASSTTTGNNYGGGGAGGGSAANGKAGAQGRVDIWEFPEELKNLAEFIVRWRYTSWE